MIKLKHLLNEAFHLPPDVDHEAELLTKFIASMFLKNLKSRTLNTKTKKYGKIVREFEDYRIAKKYKEESRGLFSIKKENIKTKWGQSSFRIINKSKLLPDVILKITNGYGDHVAGYVLGDDVDVTDEIYILVDLTLFLQTYTDCIGDLKDAIKHEIRHCIQFKNNLIGLPAKKVMWRKDVDEFGNKDSGGNRQDHSRRDIEFKTNLHTYAHYIKRMLNFASPKSDWKIDFNYIVNGINKKRRFDYIGTLLEELKYMKADDPIRWKQFVKELYDLIFNQ